MNTRWRWISWTWTHAIRKLWMALLLAVCVLLAFPGISFAHAILIRSDPTQGAVLRIPPRQVRLWFSEAIDPQLSTAQVVTPWVGGMLIIAFYHDASARGDQPLSGAHC